MPTGESLGRCGLCRRSLIRPVQTVRKDDVLYHLRCWRERTRAAAPRARPAPPRLADLLDALYHPDAPLSRPETLAALRTVALPPAYQWVRRVLDAPESS